MDLRHIDAKPKKLWNKIGKHLKLCRFQTDHHRPLHTVRGHFSLNEIRGARFPGHQTAATSLCALLQATSLCPSVWSAEVIDRLLLQGDKLHSTRVRHLKCQKPGQELQTGTLTPEELPNKFSWKHTEFDVTYSEARVLVEDIRHRNHTGNHSVLFSQTKHLQAMLEIFFRENKDGVFLTSGTKTAVVMVDDTYCYFFDPCSQQQKVFSHANKAELIKFRDLVHFVHFLGERWLVTGTACRVVGVTIDRKSDAWGDVSFSCVSSSFCV